MFKVNFKPVIMVLLSTFFALPIKADQVDGDPFAAYINSIPKVISVISSTNKGSGTQAVTTQEIVFSSRNNINKVYGVLSYPLRPGKFPGLLILHGGSGNALGLKTRVEKFATKGYVVFACDMPGYCNIENTPFSSGPWNCTRLPMNGPVLILQMDWIAARWLMLKLPAWRRSTSYGVSRTPTLIGWV